MFFQFGGQNSENRVMVVQAFLSLQPVDTAQSTVIWIGKGVENASDSLMNKSHCTPSEK